MDGEEEGTRVVLGGWSANEVWDGRGEEVGVWGEGGLEGGMAVGSRGQSNLIASVRAPEVVPPPLERQRGERYVPLVLFFTVSLGIRRVWQFVHRKR